MSKTTWPIARDNLLNFQHFYLVGIKGVAMTSLAQCLLDANKQVSGCDVAEEFVTQEILNQKQIKIDLGFTHQLENQIDCVIYTSAHQAIDNPVVQQAISKGLAVFSQAEALASLFNQKQGIAVCGVGGKSTVSAMISWILEQTQHKPSFSVGVGKIVGLKKTGAWQSTSPHFVAEADEYVINPRAREKQEAIIPRFAFLKPWMIVCNSLRYDHPDVYDNFAHTQETFWQFFLQIKNSGCLVFNANDDNLSNMAKQLQEARPDIKLISFAEKMDNANFNLLKYEVINQKAVAEFTFNNKSYQLNLKIPGKFNALNALSAIAGVSGINTDIKSIDALASFASTKRRFELIGQKNGVLYWDDYAHHPSEVSAVVEAINSWYPNKRVVVAFQSHTFSRTKQLFNEFVSAFTKAKEVVMIDIFASAREKFDATITSDLLCQAISQQYPQIKCQNLKTIEQLANYAKQQLQAGDVMITLGAGDIYLMHEEVE